MKENGRRKFLKILSGVVGGTFLSRVTDFLPKSVCAVTSPAYASSDVAAEQIEQGELYGDFLLLSSFEGLHQGQPTPVEATNYTAVRYSNLSNIPLEILSTLYLPANLPNNIVHNPVVVVETSDETNSIYKVSISYSATSSEGLYPVDIIAQYDFSMPYPVVSEQNLGLDEGRISRVEKVNFTPMPGVMVYIPMGYSIHWIEKGVLYTCILEFSTNRSRTVEFVTSLDRQLEKIN